MQRWLKTERKANFFLLGQTKKSRFGFGLHILNIMWRNTDYGRRFKLIWRPVVRDIGLRNPDGTAACILTDCGKASHTFSKIAGWTD